MVFNTSTKPEVNKISRDMEIFYFIGILDDDKKITLIGIKASDIPIDPWLSEALINTALRKNKCWERSSDKTQFFSIPNLLYNSL